jgi:hypothetical protein
MPYRIKWGDYTIECDDPSEVIDFAAKSEEVEHLVDVALCEKLRIANKRIAELEDGLVGAGGKWPKYRAEVRKFLLSNGPSSRNALVSQVNFPHCRNAFELTMRHELFRELDGGLWTLAELPDPVISAPAAPMPDEQESDQEAPIADLPAPRQPKQTNWQRAVDWIKANGPATRCAIADGCGIPYGSITDTFRRNVFVVLSGQRIGLAGVHRDEDRDDPIIERGVAPATIATPRHEPPPRPTLDATPRLAPPKAIQEEPAPDPPKPAPKSPPKKQPDNLTHQIGMFLDENPERTFQQIAAALNLEPKIVLRTLNGDERFVFSEKDACWSLAEEEA